LKHYICDMHLKQLKRLLLPGILMFFLTFLLSCKKDEVITDTSAKLSFSLDTVFFDTIFTTLGSATKRLMVYNDHNRAINISSIRLANGQSSKFRINVDGFAGVAHNDIKIAAKDSMFVFVEVTLDPNNVNTPLIVSDSIVFVTNGNIQDVDLVAWGQDAHYFRPNRFVDGLPPYSIVDTNPGANTVWTNDKPYVIYGYLVVDSACSLTIEEGTQIHFYNNAGLWIYRYGSLVVNGTKEDPVVFQGFRLEDAYKDVPGQWDRIWINESDVDSRINYAVIKNSFIGIQAESLLELTTSKLFFDNSVIKNTSGIGLLARAYNIEGHNSIIANSKENTLALTLGGDYQFRHCTFTNYSSNSTSRKVPLLFLNNHNEVQTIDLTQAYFGNCIIHGNIDEEIGFDASSTGIFNYKFDHCLVKILPGMNTDDANKYVNLVKNPSGNIFKNTGEGDFHLLENSPANDKGSFPISSSLPDLMDMDEVLRTDPPDLGAFEYVP
jgi:hypothetical protein